MGHFTTSSQKQLFLTPDGQILVQSVHETFVNLEKRVSAPVTREEKQTLLTLLDKIQSRANFNP
ncbi:hypothetical protein FD19_GL000970 [Lacticaseibacillus thailandensis DSM 22698 = JCM 13996]|uniref:HTH marR-type domain-containing protein n=1 Tax=Lacticaseibacillus thailandensis DSM 22698 = JCM 13996 TaxID=1423810 RepID=A0A0R2CG86_9LACO|nr:hypothetical protein FD19_GL000970 [Lacticaseibacillus thailandensis DSM 22698 = JCM 13996]